MFAADTTDSKPAAVLSEDRLRCLWALRRHNGTATVSERLDIATMLRRTVRAITEGMDREEPMAGNVKIARGHRPPRL